MKNLTWKSDPERKSFVIVQENAGDNPKEILDFESLYIGDERTVFGIGLIVGPIIGDKSYRLYSFDGPIPSIFGIGGEDDKDFAKSACEFEYLESPKHPFEDQLKHA
jgi:hypothetical protein